MTPGRNVRRILVILAASVLAALGGLWFWIRAAESRRWSGMEATLILLEKESASRRGRRPVLYGEPIPGNAWDDYRRAQPMFQLRHADQALYDYLHDKPDAQPDRILQILKMNEAALAALLQGARREEARRAVDWSSRGRNPYQSQSPAMAVAAQARLRSREGKIRESARLLLDGARMAADLGADGDLISGMVSMAMLSIIQDELKRLLADERLDKDSALEIESGLERLDATFPEPGQALLNQVLETGWDFLHSASVADYFAHEYADTGEAVPRVSAWRYAGFERLMIADYFDLLLDWNRRLAQTDALPWSQVSAVVSQVQAERAASKNPLAPSRIWLFADVDLRALAVYRDRRAQLRLLRIAARWRATGETLSLDDPFGHKLQVQSFDSELKAWSVGMDGVDDGGSGAWAPRAGQDIVLELKK